MADIVQRRPSRSRFGWLLGSNAPKNGELATTTAGGAKLSKTPSARGLVSGPRRMPSSTTTNSANHNHNNPDANTKTDLLPNAAVVAAAIAAASELKETINMNGGINIVDTNDSISSPTAIVKPSFDEYDFSRPPAWANKPGEWSPSSPQPIQPITQRGPRYSIHDQTGPQFYINHHLRAPASARPRTSFPPTPFQGSASSTASSNSSAPARTPARPPPRTYTDTVDSLDVSDPHGTRWHHASPYELGAGRATAAVRPRTQFLGPGVGTFAGAIEGSEPIEVVRISCPSLYHPRRIYINSESL